MTLHAYLDLRQPLAESSCVVSDREDDRAGSGLLPRDVPVRKSLIHPQRAVGAAIKANDQAPSMNQVTLGFGGDRGLQTAVLQS